MRFLVDANLSPTVAAGLSEAGFESVHVAEAGLLAAADDTILRYALTQSFVIVTADSDFAMIMALSSAASPSVVQLRGVADRHAAESRSQSRSLIVSIPADSMFGFRRNCTASLQSLLPLKV